MTDKPEVHVDPSMCIGSRTCVDIARGAFTFDDEEYVATVADPALVDEDQLLLAERSCPTGAIYVE